MLLPQLPISLCKKVLVIMHDSILPHLAQPSLMIDFLTRAYDVGTHVGGAGGWGPEPCRRWARPRYPLPGQMEAGRPVDRWLW